MKTRILFLTILLCLPISALAQEEGQLAKQLGISSTMVENLKKLVEDIPVNEQELREIRDAANIWKRDSDNSAIQLRDPKILDMQTQKVINVVDPTADQDTATKKYVDDTTGDVSYADDRTKVGTFIRDMTAASGTQEIAVGFEPKAVIFLGVLLTTSHSVGFDDGTTRTGLLMHSAGPTYSYQTTTSIYLLEAAGKTQTGIISATDSTTFTVTWTKTGVPAAANGHIRYLAFR